MRRVQRVRAAAFILLFASLVAGCSGAPARRPHALPQPPEPSVPAPAPEPAEPTPPESLQPETPSSESVPEREPETTPDDECLLPDPPPGAPRVLAAHTGWFRPVVGSTAASVISRFGVPRAGGARSHEGIDIAAPRGTPVVAPVGGRIVVSGTRGIGGNVVVLIDHDRHFEFVFTHLDRRLVEPGQRVAAGQVIGTVGTTGNAAGGVPHLHFEVRLPSGPLDPYPLMTGSPAPARAGQ